MFPANWVIIYITDPTYWGNQKQLLINVFFVIQKLVELRWRTQRSQWFSPVCWAWWCENLTLDDVKTFKGRNSLWHEPRNAYNCLTMKPIQLGKLFSSYKVKQPRFWYPPPPENERMFSGKGSSLKENLIFQPSIFSCEHLVFRQINPLNISLWQWQILLERNSSWGTPWKFNIAPENIPSQKGSSLPTIISQVPC